ncbi:MAG: carboxypeptidase-like regulatory domain-containing protein, partial [Actinomycetota bacterium]
MMGDNRGRRVLTTVVGLGLLLLVVLTGGGPAEAQTPDPPAEPATATISGVVRDAGGTPVGDVVVDLFRQSGSQPTDRGEFLTFTRTDVDGRYTFEADADQSFVLVFIAPDGRNFERDRYLRMPVATAGGQDQNVDVAFSATTDAVIGGLLINQDGVPQSGRATLFAAGGDGSRSTYLGADDISPTDGEFSFNVAPGCYIIDVTHGNLGFDGNRWFQAAGCVEAGETDLSIRAVLTGRITAEIRGTVRIGAEGEELLPAADVQVELYLPCCRPGERTFLQTTRTAADGTYSFTAAIGQSYLIVVFAPEGTTFPDGTTEA